MMNRLALAMFAFLPLLALPLRATGFNNDRQGLPGELYGARPGIGILRGADNVVRRCIAYLNGTRIGVMASSNCLIEQCVSYGNYSKFGAVSGNLMNWNTPEAGGTIRHCRSFGARLFGIKFYGNLQGPCRIEDCYAAAVGGLRIKEGPAAPDMMKLRKQECAEAARILGAEPIHLDYPQRHYHDAAGEWIELRYGAAAPEGVPSRGPTILTAARCRRRIFRISRRAYERNNGARCAGVAPRRSSAGCGTGTPANGASIPWSRSWWRTRGDLDVHNRVARFSACFRAG